jgi:hypothetical protein
MKLVSYCASLPLLTLSVAFLAACGGGETPRAETPADVDERPAGSGRPKMSASSEIGALDEAKVTSTFRSAQGDLQRCLAEGAERNELEGGDVAFFLKIDTSGSVAHAHVERSTLGDLTTEQCMLRALKKRDWPAPQGGDIGIARSSMGFDPPNDVRPPTDWDPSRVEDTLRQVSGKLSSCKREASGELTATVYVDADGAALSVGAAASDESGASAIDCVVEVLKEAKYPSPGSWPAKVTFPL